MMEPSPNQKRNGLFLVVILVVLAISVVAVFSYRHWHHSPKTSRSSTNGEPTFDTPPVPGTETVRAEPLFDAENARHLDVPSVSPAAITPTTVKNAYSVPVNLGGAGTIAIVEAYNDPNAEADLNTLSTLYSLRSCTYANACFERHKMAPNLPTDEGWALETALDTQWAHAIAPNARILLVEAKSNLISDLMNAVDYARSRPDVVAISLSWGSSEFAGETGYDSRLISTHGLQIFAASGDNGHGIWWPAAAPTVVGVGGTTLTLNGNGSFNSETAWSGSGGGLSVYESEPAFQLTYNIPSAGSKRGVPDVSYNADPATGYAVYDSFPNGGYTGWWTMGGTSAGAPQWAALQSVGRRVNLSRLYQNAAGPNYSSYFRDINSGNNGGCGSQCNSVSGYDYVTGLGSPLTPQF